MSKYYRVKTLMLKGQDGKGISSISKTGTSGLVDTYTIMMTDGTKSTFTVANGANGVKGDTGPQGQQGVKGQDGQSIKEIKKTSTSGLIDTYEITLTEGTKKSFTVTNGKGIKSIAKTSTSGLTDTYTITYNDGTTSTFTVKNGDSVKEKCIIDYTVTESAQKVSVNLSDIGNRNDIINSLANASRVGVYMYSGINTEQNANEVTAIASIRAGETIEYFRLIGARISKSFNLKAVSIADRVASDLPYFEAITAGNMGHVYSNDFRELNKAWEARASLLDIRVADGLLVPQGTIIKVYVK
nr:MAG TPA: Pulmonary surfactant-associated protein D, c-type lectin, alpha-helical coiled [Caudoviricetes sp.]